MIHKGFLLYDLLTHKVFTSRDVKFFPETYPFSTPVTEDAAPSLPLVEITGEDVALDSDEETASADRSCTEEPPINDHQANIQPAASDIVPLRRSTRSHHPPSWMKDYIGTVQTGATILPSTSLTPSTFPYFISPNLSSSYITYLFNILTIHEPTSYTEASSHPEWVQAMQDELNALESNHTWDLVPLPAGKRPIGNKWVYKLKLKANGDVDRCKARLVAKGFTQEPGIDYQEVFSPVTKLVTIRVLFALASSMA